MVKNVFVTQDKTQCSICNPKLTVKGTLQPFSLSFVSLETQK